MLLGNPQRKFNLIITDLLGNSLKPDKQIHNFNRQNFKFFLATNLEAGPATSDSRNVERACSKERVSKKTRAREGNVRCEIEILTRNIKEMMSGFLESYETGR